MDQAGGGDSVNWGYPAKVLRAGGGPRATIPQSACVGIVVPRQLQTQWCWAAVSLGVATLYSTGTPWTQCSIVNAELNLTGCCQNGASSACNQPWFLHRALLRVRHFDSTAMTALPFADVQQQIALGRPTCARIGWSGGGGHFMAINCWYTSFVAPGDRYLQIADPWFGLQTYEFSAFATAYQGRGTWTHWYKTKP